MTLSLTPLIFGGFLAMMFLYQLYSVKETALVVQAYEIEMAELRRALEEMKTEAPVTTINPQLKRTFETFYAKKVWSAAGRGSGAGSSMAATESARKIILDIIREYGIKCMVDAPCGGMLWMPHVLRQLPPTFSYVGIDVAEPMILSHQKEFVNWTNWVFLTDDITTRLPPNSDLVFSRDALQHLPSAYVRRFINTVRESRAKYLLVGSYLENGNNREISIGDYFNINLLQPPFSLPTPFASFKETSSLRGHPPKFLLLFNASTLPVL
jgi:hypothetical protein